MADVTIERIRATTDTGICTECKKRTITRKVVVAEYPKSPVAHYLCTVCALSVVIHAVSRDE